MQSFLQLRTVFGVFLLDALTFIKLCICPRTTIAAENLFLRKQLGLFIGGKQNLAGRRMPFGLRWLQFEITKLDTVFTIVTDEAEAISLIQKLFPEA